MKQSIQVLIQIKNTMLFKFILFLIAIFFSSNFSVLSAQVSSNYFNQIGNSDVSYIGPNEKLHYHFVENGKWRYETTTFATPTSDISDFPSPQLFPIVDSLGLTQYKLEVIKNESLIKEVSPNSYSSLESLKIVSFNIGMGAGRKDKPQFLELKESIPELISFIKNELISKNEKAVICLQEVDFNNPRSGNINFLKELKNNLGNEWNYYYYDPTNENNQKYGIGIITNLNGTKSDGKPKEQKWKIFDADSGEDRGAIAIKLKFEENPIWIVNTHLGFTNPASQINTIINRINTFDTKVPVIICGDFNVADLDYLYGARSKNFSLYKQTISKLEGNGFFKSMITEGAPNTWHSWNGRSNGVILDYIMTSYPYPSTVIKNLALHKKVKSKTPTITINAKKYYFSDHNAIIMDYSFD